MPRKAASKKRDVIVTGNWKMYKTIGEAKQFIENLAAQIQESQVKICLAVPFTALFPAAQLTKHLNTSIEIGAQNMNDATEGAFTGEIAAKMLKDAGASFVIVGHSERRHLFHETSAFINRKVKRALKDGLTPLVCVGETLEERKAGRTEEVLERQLTESLEGVDLSLVQIGYEPVWAIGTGVVATPSEAELAHLFCRKVLEKVGGKKEGSVPPILYGGSVKSENAKELIAQSAVDGFLVGGASLEPKSFYEIIQIAGTKVL